MKKKLLVGLETGLFTFGIPNWTSITDQYATLGVVYFIEKGGKVK